MPKKILQDSIYVDFSENVHAFFVVVYKTYLLCVIFIEQKPLRFLNCLPKCVCVFENLLLHVTKDLIYV